MNKFSNKLKKPCLWPILGSLSQFLEQKKFSWKIWLCYTQLHMVFYNHTKFLKSWWYNSKKMSAQMEGQTEEWMERWTDGQTLFYRTLPATAGGPTTKKHLFRLLMAIVFRYYHYECFSSLINLTKLTFVEGGLGNSLNKNCVRFSDTASLKN